MNTNDKPIKLIKIFRKINIINKIRIILNNKVTISQNIKMKVNNNIISLVMKKTIKIINRLINKKKLIKLKVSKISLILNQI